MGTALRRPRVLGALGAEAALAVIDIASGPAFVVRSLYLLPVLLLAVRGEVREVALVGVVAVILAAISPAWGQPVDHDYARLLAVVAIGSAIAVWVARERQAAERERRQMRLLADAAQITDGAADMDDALGRLVALLVPELADAAWIDVVAPTGDPRRLAVRFDGADAAELERWLAERPRTSPSSTRRAGACWTARDPGSPCSTRRGSTRSRRAPRTGVACSSRACAPRWPFPWPSGASARWAS